MSSKLKKSKQKNQKKPKKKNKILSTQKTLGFDVLEKNGVMSFGKNLYSKTYDLGSANYITASHDEKLNMFTSYFDAINAYLKQNIFNYPWILKK